MDQMNGYGHGNGNGYGNGTVNICRLRRQGEDKKLLFDLPNFDPAVFREITGIDVNDE